MWTQSFLKSDRYRKVCGFSLPVPSSNPKPKRSMLSGDIYSHRRSHSSFFSWGCVDFEECRSVSFYNSLPFLILWVWKSIKTQETLKVVAFLLVLRAKLKDVCAISFQASAYVIFTHITQMIQERVIWTVLWFPVFRELHYVFSRRNECNEQSSRDHNGEGLVKIQVHDWLWSHYRTWITEFPRLFSSPCSLNRSFNSLYSFHSW